MAEKTLLQRFTGHLKTVLVHKYYVAEGCFRCGLYFQGIVHDFSKFSPTEFFVGVKYFDGHRSPNAYEKKQLGYSTAWLHHKGRNRHHFEYWMDLRSNPEAPIGAGRMPIRYIAEMVCDRRAACIAYNGRHDSREGAWKYYYHTCLWNVIDPDADAVLATALVILRDEGEDACWAFLKRMLKITKGSDYTAESLGLPPVSEIHEKEGIEPKPYAL